MFASKEFIELSRKFVCVRIDSYESEQHQEWVRRFLNGRFANTAFCVLSPDGQEWLTRSGRSPGLVFGDQANPDIVKSILERFPAKADQSESVIQDFHSVRQALNVASADQRVLVLVSGPEPKLEELRESLKPVANHPDVVGKFHFDFESKSDWTSSIAGMKGSEGILIIRPGEFGIDGQILQQLSLSESNQMIKKSLASSNELYAATTMKKDHGQHVAKGRRMGVYFEGAVPYGEDRDADGVIDKGQGQNNKRRRRDRD